MATQPSADRRWKPTRIEVSQLFGLFDHTIPLSPDDRVTIIHAPNGFGKTAILRLVNALSKLRYPILRDTEYERLVVHFENDTAIEVHRAIQPSTASSSSEDSSIRLTFSRYKEGKQIEKWRRPDTPSHGMISPSMVERFVPTLERVGSRVWRSTETGKLYNLVEIADEFSDQFPEKLRGLATPRWLLDFQKGFVVHLVETQRLLTLQAESESRPWATRSEPQLVPVVRTYAKHLAALIKGALTNYATYSQSLDRTFPNRVLQSLQQSPMKEQDIRAALEELEKSRERLRTAGFLEEEQAVVETGPLGSTARRVLAVYVDDVRKKLARFDDLYSKVENFSRVLGSHLKFKTIEVSKEEGFFFKDSKGKRLDLDLLSSGEQHELVMTYELLFRTSTGSLILIDEPEISLHIEWQITFLNDLVQMLDKTNSLAIVATHSPQIVNNRTDLMVSLKAPD